MKFRTKDIEEERREMQRETAAAHAQTVFQMDLAVRAAKAVESKKKGFTTVRESAEERLEEAKTKKAESERIFTLTEADEERIQYNFLTERVRNLEREYMHLEERINNYSFYGTEKEALPQLKLNKFIVEETWKVTVAALEELEAKGWGSDLEEESTETPEGEEESSDTQPLSQGDKKPPKGPAV